MVTTFLTRGNIKITPETSLVTNAVVRPFFFFFYRILVTCVVNTVFVEEGEKVFIDFDSILSVVSCLVMERIERQC